MSEKINLEKKEKYRTNVPLIEYQPLVYKYDLIPVYHKIIRIRNKKAKRKIVILKVQTKISCEEMCLCIVTSKRKVRNNRTAHITINFPRTKIVQRNSINEIIRRDFNVIAPSYSFNETLNYEIEKANPSVYDVLILNHTLGFLPQNYPYLISFKNEKIQKKKNIYEPIAVSYDFFHGVLPPDAEKIGTVLKEPKPEKKDKKKKLVNTK